MDRKKQGDAEKRETFKTPAPKRKYVEETTPNEGRFRFGIDDPVYVEKAVSEKTPGTTRGISRSLSLGQTPGDQTKRMVDAMTSPSLPIVPPPPESRRSSLSSASTSVANRMSSTFVPPPPPPDRQNHQPFISRRSEGPSYQHPKRSRRRSSQRKKKKSRHRKKKKSKKRRKRKGGDESFGEEFSKKVHSQVNHDLPVTEQYIETIKLICEKLKRKYRSSKSKSNEEQKEVAGEILYDFNEGMEDRYQEYFREIVVEVANPQDDINKARIELLEQKIAAIREEKAQWLQVQSELEKIEMKYPQMNAEDFQEEEILKQYEQQQRVKSDIPRISSLTQECLGEYEIVTDSILNYSRNSVLLISGGEEMNRKLVSRIKEMGEMDKTEKDPKDLVRDFLI